MTKHPRKTITDWQRLVSKELRGRAREDLNWQTPEAIKVNPLYTADDTSDIA
ncbi:MAG: hypothetical protein GXP02_03040, partial [Alphaproteobacteria bacterium]|nr:hypothetical protein [Alphaproteobacteria bacterium]